MTQDLSNSNPELNVKYKGNQFGVGPIAVLVLVSDIFN